MVKDSRYTSMQLTKEGKKFLEDQLRPGESYEELLRRKGVIKGGKR
jgi:hypothetical protein